MHKRAELGARERAVGVTVVLVEQPQRRAGGQAPRAELERAEPSAPWCSAVGGAARGRDDKDARDDVMAAARVVVARGAEARGGEDRARGELADAAAREEPVEIDARVPAGWVIRRAVDDDDRELVWAEVRSTNSGGRAGRATFDRQRDDAR